MLFGKVWASFTKRCQFVVDMYLAGLRFQKSNSEKYEEELKVLLNNWRIKRDFCKSREEAVLLYDDFRRQVNAANLKYGVNVHIN